MLSIKTSADMERALAGPLDPALRELLAARRDQLADEGLDLAELAHFVVPGPGDTLASVEAEAGVSLSVNYGDNTKLGDADFKPSWEYVERHPGGWREVVLILSDDGYGVVILISDRIDLDPAFHLLLARHAAA